MAAQHQQITDELQEKASLFAVGALTDDERAEFARHLEEDDCAVCRAEVSEFESAVNLLAFEAPLLTPSARVRQRLMDQAQTAAQVPKRVPWAAWTAAILGLTTVA